MIVRVSEGYAIPDSGIPVASSGTLATYTSAVTIAKNIPTAMVMATSIMPDRSVIATREKMGARRPEPLFCLLRLCAGDARRKATRRVCVGLRAHLPIRLSHLGARCTVRVEVTARVDRPQRVARWADLEGSLGVLGPADVIHDGHRHGSVVTRSFPHEYTKDSLMYEKPCRRPLMTILHAPHPRRGQQSAFLLCVCVAVRGP